MKENIEEDIKIVQEFLIEQNKRNQRLIDNPYRQLFYTDEEVQAIENILSDYKRVLKENKELKKFIVEGITIETNSPYQNYQLNFLRENFIPVQKIKDKIEELKEEYKTDLEKNSTRAFILKCQITILEDLLEEKEDKQ